MCLYIYVVYVPGYVFVYIHIHTNINREQMIGVAKYNDLLLLAHTEDADIFPITLRPSVLDCESRETFSLTPPQFHLFVSSCLATY